MKATPQVSVRVLVEHSLRTGDLNLEAFAFSSTFDAIRAHQKVQASRPEGYRKEVTVSREFERGDICLEVVGRIDGVWERESGPLIEEIKTTRKDPRDCALEESPTHWGQLRVYAFLYGKDKGLESIETRLTYYQLDTGETVEIERRFALVDLEELVDELVSRYSSFIAWVEARVSSRNQSVGRAAFPFPSYRIGQREMAVAVYRTVSAGGEVMVRAPTGVGKTHGALFPAVKALGENHTDRVFYLTARTTGRALAEKALAAMRDQDVRIRAVTLTAKEKICFNKEKSCNGEECTFARGFYDRLASAVDEALEAEALTRDGIEALARKHHLCPFELSLEAATFADVIIGDYNYAFDPRTHLRRFFDEGSAEGFSQCRGAPPPRLLASRLGSASRCTRAEGSTLLVDEAHNLVDRARDMFSASISRDGFLSLKRLLGRASERSLVRSIEKVTASIGRAWKKDSALGDGFAEPVVPAELVSALSGFLRKAELELQKPGGDGARRQLVERSFEAAWFTKIAERWDETYSACFAARGQDRVVTLFCTDPAPRLKETFSSVKAVALFSATLSPPDYFKRCLGLSSESRALSLPPAFPRENLCVLVDDRIATSYRRRGATEGELATLLSSFVSQKRGNYFIYFPSYTYLRAIHRRFVLERPEVTMLVQEPGMSEEARDAFLDRFGIGNGTLVGFAVMGGFFGEGIDLPGERLEGAAVVGVGLPALSAERDCIRDRFERSEGSGFDYAYVYPGMNRVLQAAGRVIRSETDRGVVLLIDERFRERRYRTLLPPEWTPRFVRGPGELQTELAGFWSKA